MDRVSLILVDDCEVKSDFKNYKKEYTLGYNGSVLSNEIKILNRNTYKETEVACLTSYLHNNEKNISIVCGNTAVLDLKKAFKKIEEYAPMFSFTNLNADYETELIESYYYYVKNYKTKQIFLKNDKSVTILCLVRETGKYTDCKTDVEFSFNINLYDTKNLLNMDVRPIQILENEIKEYYSIEEVEDRINEILENF